jgi:putative ABC transport system permease protein
MVWLAYRNLVTRRVGSILAALGLLTATLGFIVLSGTSKTTDAVLRGDIREAWQTPYDLLVRPKGSQTELEQSLGLVRPNFLSNRVGGITEAQLGQVRAIPGVTVAAPIAVVGSVQIGTNSTAVAIPVDLSQHIGSRAVVAFRIQPTLLTDGGLSRFPMPASYALVAPDGTYDLSKLTVGAASIPCAGVAFCFAGNFTCPQPGTCGGFQVGSHERVPGLAPGVPGAPIYFPLTLTLAGVDPVAEAQLTGLGQCLRSGSVLSAGSLTRNEIPVLMPTRSLLDESLSIDISEPTNSDAVLTGVPPKSLVGWHTVTTETGHPDQALLSFEQQLAGDASFLNLSPLWLPSDIKYSTVSPGQQIPETVAPDIQAYANPYVANVPAAQNAPPEAQDTWFRSLTSRIHQQNGSASPANSFRVVGNFDPSCLPQFAGTGATNLSMFRSPSVTTDSGMEIGPNRSLGGYESAPPLLLTTLEGAAYFASSDRYVGGPGSAYISAIRVRVSATQSPNPVAQGRLSRVAADIHDATGLQVDIVKGSSPKPVSVALAAGHYGRPALTVNEPWTVIGLAYRFLVAVSVQNLALFMLLLVGAAILIGETAYVSVHRRRKEFGTLRALGWPALRIAWLVEVEMLILGLATGLVAVLAGGLANWAFRLGLSAWQVIGTVPIALLIAATAAILPAMAARRGSAASAMQFNPQFKPGRIPSSAWSVGLRELASTWRIEASMGALAIALGATLFGGVVMLSWAFQGQLDTSFLGTYLAVRVRPFHIVLAALALAMGTIAAGEVVTLGYIERRAHLAVLRAVGWPRLEVAKFIVAQAASIGTAGGIVGAIATISLGFAIAAPFPALLVGGVGALLMTAAGTLVAALAPLAEAMRFDPASALRGE